MIMWTLNPAFWPSTPFEPPQRKIHLRTNTFGKGRLMSKKNYVLRHPQNGFEIQREIGSLSHFEREHPTSATFSR